MAIRFRTGLILEGASLRNPWAIPESDIQVLDSGESFIRAGRDNRNLALSVNLDTKGTHSWWLNNSTLDYLISLRTSAVDELLVQTLTQNDPLGERPVSPTKKAKRDVAHMLPTTVELLIPDSDNLPQHKMKVLTTYRKSDALWIEAKVANWEYIGAMVLNPTERTVRWSERNSQKQGYSDDCPDVKLVKLSGSSHQLRVLTEHGWKTKCVPRSACSTLWKQMADEAARELQSLVTVDSEGSQD